MITFSIIMPCYNLEAIVHRTIESVMKQTYKNFELIIIDDGSTDNTLKVLKGYEKQDNRIKVFSKENGGVFSARNFGITKASGEYIQFLDGDDLIESILLDKAINILNLTSADMFSFGYKKINENLDYVIKRYSFKRSNKSTFSGYNFQRMYFSREIAQHISSFIIKKSIILENSILFNEDTKYAEDQEFQLKCNVKCKNIFMSQMNISIMCKERVLQLIKK